MSGYPMCDHDWSLPGGGSRLFCAKCGGNFDYVSHVEKRIAELEADKLVLMERDEKYCKTISGLQTANLELEEGNRLAVAEAYRCGFEAGKVESDLWGEAATTIEKLETDLEIATVFNQEQARQLKTIKEKARAAVNAPYGRALRELEELF